MTSGPDPIEEKIREAIARGEFDNLPGTGKPLDTADSGPGWWARRFVEKWRAGDRAARLAQEIDQGLGEVWVVRDERSVRERVAQLNKRLAEANLGLAEENRVDLLDPDQVVSTWRQMFRARR